VGRRQRIGLAAVRTNRDIIVTPDPTASRSSELYLGIEKDLSPSFRDPERAAAVRSPDRLDAAVMALVQSVGLARLGWGATTHEVYH